MGRFRGAQELVRMENGSVTRTQVVNQLHDYILRKRRGIPRLVYYKDGKMEIGNMRPRLMVVRTFSVQLCRVFMVI